MEQCFKHISFYIYIMTDVKNIYLNTPLNHFEYMHTPLKLNPEHFIQ